MASELCVSIGFHAVGGQAVRVIAAQGGLVTYSVIESAFLAIVLSKKCSAAPKATGLNRSSAEGCWFAASEIVGLFV